MILFYSLFNMGLPKDAPFLPYHFLWLFHKWEKENKGGIEYFEQI